MTSDALKDKSAKRSPHREDGKVAAKPMTIEEAKVAQRFFDGERAKDWPSTPMQRRMQG